MILAQQAPRVVDLFLAGDDPRNPDGSPLYGDPTGLPPTLILVGGDDLLRDDAVRITLRCVPARADFGRELS